MLHLPLLRRGKPYRSLATVELTDVRDGRLVAEVSQANPGLIAADLARRADRGGLGELTAGELAGICRRAAPRFAEAELPAGETAQGPEEYVAQLSATTGIPHSLCRENLAKIRFVLEHMQTVVDGLTRGLDPQSLDRGFGREGNRTVSYLRQADVLGVVLPSNSPGVHSLWIPALALKVPVALRPGAREPWTPYRVAQALLAAGLPPAAVGFYPSDHAGAVELLLRCERSMLFGDRATVRPWEADPRVQLHGPGWSKVILGPDRLAGWEEHLELIETSVVSNGGRSCVNASGLWISRGSSPAGRQIAEALADRLAAIEARPLTDPEARLAAFSDPRAAHRLSEFIDRQLAVDGAEDLTARRRPGGRIAEVDGCTFLLPTVVWCDDPSHPLAEAEFLFPFVTVVEVDPGDLVARVGPTLVATALTEDRQLIAALMDCRRIERLNLGPIPTSRVVWDQPHEGNLFQHLYRQRAFQLVDRTAVASDAGVCR